MKTWKQDETEFLPKVYLWSTVIGGLDFSRGLFLVYFLSIGFSGAEVGTLQAILFWTSFALELPSGIFADRFGRKKSLVFGFVCLILAFLTLSIANTFGIALVAFSLWGAGFAFTSGAGSALLYDGLKESNRLESHIHWLAKVRAIGTFLMAFAIVAGGYLYQASPVLIFLTSASCAMVGLLMLLKLPEPKLEQNIETKQTHVHLKEFFQSPNGRTLLLFMIGLATFEMAHTPFFIFSQSLFSANGVSSEGISTILGAGFLFSSLFQRLAPYFAKGSLQSRILFVGGCMIAGLIMVGSVSSTPVLVLLFLLINALPQMLFVYTDQYIQDHCESHIRATLLSVHSFVNVAFIGVTYLAVGILSDRIGMNVALSTLSIPVVIGCALVLWYFSLKKVQK